MKNRTNDETTGIRPYGPGKFNTMLDAYVYDVSLESGGDADAQIGDTHYELLRHGSTIFLDPSSYGDFDKRDLNAVEREKLDACAGVIVIECSDGFVFCDYFTDAEELDAAWLKICRESDDFYAAEIAENGLYDDWRDEAEDFSVEPSRNGMAGDFC